MHGHPGPERHMGAAHGLRFGRLRSWLRPAVALVVVMACVATASADAAAWDHDCGKSLGGTAPDGSLPQGDTPILSAPVRAILQARPGPVLPEDLAGVQQGQLPSLEGAPATSRAFVWERPECTMLLPVVGDESGTRVSGRVLDAPYQGDVEWTKPKGGQAALAGKIELGFRDACPEGARQLSEFLNDGKFFSNTKKGVVTKSHMRGVVHGVEEDLRLELKNMRMWMYSNGPLQVANNQVGLAVTVGLREGSLVIHNGTENRSFDLTRIRATAVGNGQILEQDGEVRIQISDLPYRFDTAQLAEKKLRIRLILEFVTNITARVDLPLDAPAKPGATVAAPGANATALGNETAGGLPEQVFPDGPVVTLSEVVLTEAATVMAAPVFVLAVVGVCLTLVTFWHLPTVRACLTPLDKKTLRQVADTMDRGMTMGSMGGGRVPGVTDIGGGGRGMSWVAGAGRPSFGDMSMMDMDVGRSTMVGSGFSRGSLTFQRITCSVPVRRGSHCLGRAAGSAVKSKWAEFEKGEEVWRGKFQYKIILHPCSGVLKGGELTGVLGPAGSGKKAMLRILSGDQTDVDRDAVIQGSVFTQGTGFQQSKVTVGMVAGQIETLKSMTVAEAMVYTALLKSKPGTEITLIKQRILMAAEELQLTPLMSRFVSGKGLTGAERRRLMVACELQLDPDILLLEEPTTGLSGQDATNVAKALRQVSRFGRAVLMSLSQPSNDVLSALDNTMLLGRGYMVFNGPTREASRFFAHAGIRASPSTFPQQAMKALSKPEYLARLIQEAQKEDGPLQGVALMPALSFKVVNRNIRRRRNVKGAASGLSTRSPYMSLPNTTDGGVHGHGPGLASRVVSPGIAKSMLAGSSRQGLMAGHGQSSHVDEDRGISSTSSHSSPSEAAVQAFELNNGLSGAQLENSLESHWFSARQRCGPDRPETMGSSPSPSSSTPPPVRRTKSRFVEEKHANDLGELDNRPDEQRLRPSSIDSDGENPAPQRGVTLQSSVGGSFDDETLRVQVQCEVASDGRSSADLLKMAVPEASAPGGEVARTGTLLDVNGIPAATAPSGACDDIEDSAKTPWKPLRKSPGRGSSLKPGEGLQPSSPLRFNHSSLRRPPINPRGSLCQRRVVVTDQAPPKGDKAGGEEPGSATAVHRSDTAMPMLEDRKGSGSMRSDRYLKDAPVRQSVSLESALLFWRGMNHMYRRLTMLTAHGLAALGFGALLGLVFFDLDSVDTDELRSHSTALMMTMVALSISGVASACGVSAERALAVHEVRTRHYHTMVYVLVHSVLSFLILRFIPVCLFSGVFLSMSELDTWSTLSWMTSMRIVLFVGGLTTFWGTIAGMANLVLSMKATGGFKTLALIAVVLYGPLVSGFLIPKDKIPWPVGYIHYASPFSVTFEALMISEFSGINIDTSRQITAEASEGTLPSLEEDSFHSMGLDEDNIVIDSVLGVVFYAIIVILAVVGVWVKSKRPHALSFWRGCCW
eukprot:evm.model.scf_614.4 EVM.evm.TU.scf_614.4   scf_614:13119-25432(-)